MAATGSERGELRTKRFPLLSPFLYLNGAAEGGLVEIELLDADSQAVLGSATMKELDSIYASVPWRAHELAAIQAHLGREVQLRFCLQHAELFSWWFEPQPPPEY